MFGVLRQAFVVKQSSQKSIFSQIQEALKLRFSDSKLGPSEYYLYRLHLLENFSDKKEFVGWRYSAYLDKRLNQDAWRVFANDKVIFYAMMEAHGLAYPHTVAIFDPYKKARLKDCHMIDSLAGAAKFLRDPSIYPLFMKPISGTYGRGAFSAVSYDSQSDALRMGNGRSRAIGEVLEMFQAIWARGYVMQHLLEPHIEVETVVGKRLSSLRVIVLLTKQGPYIFRAVWKLPTGNNMSDNFMHGETGNLIANIDLDAGRIGQAVTGTGGDIRAVECHPNTGTALSNLRVPMWDEVKNLVITGASMFPGLRMQHWDVALCPQGPVALEVNVEGSMDLHQLASSKGINDITMRRVQLDL